MIELSVPKLPVSTAAHAFASCCTFYNVSLTYRILNLKCLYNVFRPVQMSLLILAVNISI